MNKEQIVSVVCEVCGVTQDQLFTPSRVQKNVRARQLCWFLFKDLLNISASFTGLYFNRDHSTVLSGIKRFDWELERSQDARDKYGEAIAVLSSVMKKAA